MNSITMAIIFILFIGFFIFQIIKKFLLNNLDKSINKKDYALTVTLSDMSLARRFLGDYTCDLYKAKAYYLDKNVDKFEILPYHTMGEFKWRELGIPYKLEGVKPPTKERVQNAKDLMETESYQDYLKRVKG